MGNLCGTAKADQGDGVLDLNKQNRRPGGSRHPEAQQVQDPPRLPSLKKNIRSSRMYRIRRMRYSSTSDIMLPWLTPCCLRLFLVAFPSLRLPIFCHLHEQPFLSPLVPLLRTTAVAILGFVFCGC